MRLQGSGHEGRRGEIKRNDRHCPARRLDILRGMALIGSRRRRRRCRDHQPIERHRHDQVDPGPDQAGFAPAEAVLEPGRGGPANRAGEAREQCDAGDRSARLAAVEPSQRGKGSVVKPHRHADPQQEPSNDEPHDSLRHAERRKTSGEHEVREGQHGAAAMPVDQRPDIGADRGGEQQGRREDAEEHPGRQAEAGGDRRAEDRRQVIARRPGERL